jgi:hypothetical protein
MQRSRLTAVLVLTLASAFATADVYKWTDAHGAVHYGDRPPGTGTDARSVTLPPAPAKDADHGQRSLKRQRLLEAFDAQRAEKERAATKSAAVKRARRDQCEKASRELARWERASIIYTENDNGTRVYMSDEERRKTTAEARLWIGKHCD